MVRGARSRSYSFLWLGTRSFVLGPWGLDQCPRSICFCTVALSPWFLYRELWRGLCPH